jgi:16S rRNA C1402 (ribose-2'-O) methylase RsmI
MMYGLGVDPPITAADAQALIAAALANQQLALASQLANERNEERSHMAEWQALHRSQVVIEKPAQWIKGIENQIVLLILAVAGFIYNSNRRG